MTTDRTTRLLIGSLLAMASAAPLLGQVGSAQAGRVIRGLVYDSVAARPLAGASVQLAVADGVNAPLIVSSDSAGRYRFDEVAAGRYVLGFYHDALTTLGLDAPTRAVVLSADADVTADLAIPSSETIRALRCGAAPGSASGMLVGFVRDTESRAAIIGTNTTVHWRAFALDSANYRVVDERAVATTEPDGAFLVCHLPVAVPLDLRVTAPGHRDVAGTVVTIPANGIGRLDVLLTAVIRGRVTRESGKAVESGRVVIKALGREVAVQNGDFVVASIPAGTWVAEARVIGVEPQDVLVTASDSVVTTATITVSNSPQRLDAVTVVGKMDRNLRVLDEVLRRKRLGTGTTFLPGHPALKSAHFVADVMKEARGFRYLARDEVMTYQGCKYIAVYVDGDPLPDGFERLDHLVAMKDVLAIETWASRGHAPVMFQYGLGYSDPRRPHARLAPCAVVAVWTHRRF